MQAIVLDVGGEILGVAGLYYLGSKIICFSDFKPGSERYKKSIILGSRMMISL